MSALTEVSCIGPASCFNAGLELVVDSSRIIRELKVKLFDLAVDILEANEPYPASFYEKELRRQRALNVLFLDEPTARYIIELARKSFSLGQDRDYQRSRVSLEDEQGDEENLCPSSTKRHAASVSIVPMEESVFLSKDPL